MASSALVETVYGPVVGFDEPGFIPGLSQSIRKVPVRKFLVSLSMCTLLSELSSLRHSCPEINRFYTPPGCPLWTSRKMEESGATYAMEGTTSLQRIRVSKSHQSSPAFTLYPIFITFCFCFLFSFCLLLVRPSFPQFPFTPFDNIYPEPILAKRQSVQSDQKGFTVNIFSSPDIKAGDNVPVMVSLSSQNFLSGVL